MWRPGRQSNISAVITIANSFEQYTPIDCYAPNASACGRTEPTLSHNANSNSAVNLPVGDVDIVYCFCVVMCPDCQFHVQQRVLMLVLCMATAELWRAFSITVLTQSSLLWWWNLQLIYPHITIPQSTYVYKQGQIPKTSHHDANSLWWPVHYPSHLTFIITNFLYYITIDTHNCIVLDTKPNPLMKHCITSLVLFSVSYRRTYVYAPVYAYVYVQSLFENEWHVLTVCLKTSWRVFSQEPVCNVGCIHSVIQLGML